MAHVTIMPANGEPNNKEEIMIAGTLQNITDTKLIAAVRDNSNVAEIYDDIMQSVRKTLRIEGMLYGSRSLGNQTEAAIMRADREYAESALTLEYDMSRDAIDEINNTIGGNVVDMSGSNRDICKRFYYKYRNVA